MITLLVLHYTYIHIHVLVLLDSSFGLFFSMKSEPLIDF